ncbi:uncharacterized protein PS065_020709 [Dugong dugon]
MVISYDALNRGRGLSGVTRGGEQDLDAGGDPEDLVGNCGPRRLRCVRRTPGDQSGQRSPSQSEIPSRAERRRGASQSPASTCQYCSLPTRGVPVLAVRRASRPSRVCGPQVAMLSRTPSLSRLIPPRVCRVTPTHRVKLPKPPPPPRSVTYWEGEGNRGTGETVQFPSEGPRSRAPPSPQEEESALKGLNPRGSLGLPPRGGSWGLPLSRPRGATLLPRRLVQETLCGLKRRHCLETMALTPSLVLSCLQPGSAKPGSYIQARAD